MPNLKSKAVMEVKTAMVKGRVQEMCGLGLTILDDRVGRSVVGINITATKNSNNRGTIIVVVFDETRQ